MLGDYPKSLDGVDRRPFSLPTPVSASHGPPISRLALPPRPLLPPPTWQLSSTVSRPAAKASTPAAADAPAEPALDHLREPMGPPQKAPASLARIRLGEHTVLWQRSGQNPVWPIAAYGVAAASPVAAQSSLVDDPDTAPRGFATTDDMLDREYDAPLDDLPFAPPSEHDDGSSGGLPEWMLQHGSAEKQRHTVARADGEPASPPCEGREALAGDATDPSMDADMPQAPATQAGAIAEPEPLHSADDEQRELDVDQRMAAERQPSVSGGPTDVAEPADGSDGRGEPDSDALSAGSQGDDARAEPSQVPEQSPLRLHGAVAGRRSEAPGASAKDPDDRPAKRCAIVT